MNVLHGRKYGIFGAQHSPMPTGLHVLMQAKYLYTLFNHLIYVTLFHCAGVGSCGETSFFLFDIITVF